MSKLTNSNRFAVGMVGAILVLSGTMLPANAAKTYNQNNSVALIDRNNHNNYVALSWNGIWQKIKRKKVAGGSRSDSLCLVSPNLLIDKESQANKIKEIWHPNPLFVWRSPNLEALGIKDGDSIYWQQEVETTQTYLLK